MFVVRVSLCGVLCLDPKTEGRVVEMVELEGTQISLMHADFADSYFRMIRNDNASSITSLSGRNSRRFVIRLSIFFLFLFSLANAQEIRPIQRIHGEVLLDGLSTEPGWQSIDPLPLVMQSPTYEGLMTERTEFRVAYDDEYLYVSVRCYDSEPDKIQATSYARDALNPADDFICLLLDTFNDNENGLTFITTPVGLREDWAVSNDAEPLLAPFPFNPSWSTFWDSWVQQTSEGWFAEMRIPLSSLRFEDDNGTITMGMTMFRYIPRKNELHIFPNIPPKWAWGVIKPSVAQKIRLEGIQRQNAVYVTPYVLGGTGRNFELNIDTTAYNRETSINREIGLDVKYSITSNLTLDLTLNTDFAQVEADDQQVNLTRFSLFFPEKRLFFQERSSIFDVPMGGANQLFYSRQIGLSEEGPVRIFGGARLVGRVGGWDLGFLNMQTDKSIDLPSENFGVLRLRRRIINPNSTVGAILTSRAGTDGSSNYAYGLDATIRAVGDDYLQLNWAQVFDHELVKPRFRTGLNVARARVQWERRTSVGLGYAASVSYAGRDFYPGVGFAERVNYTRFGDQIFFGWLGGDDSPFFSQILTLKESVHLNNDDSSVESSELGPEWMFNFKSGAFGQVSFKRQTENLHEEFELSDDITIPIGTYEFYIGSVMYQTPWGNLLKSAFTLNAGSFFDGTRISIGVTPGWNLSAHVELSGDYQFNKIRFPARKELFNTHIGRIRLKATLDTKISAAAFVQFNSEARTVTVNFRFRYNPKDGNDFYIVYDEGINTDRFRELPIRPTSESRTLLLKYSHTFQF